MENYRYSPSDEMDYILLNWRATMLADGDFDHTFSQGVRTPSAFLHFFSERGCVFRADDFGNLTQACWVEPCMGSAFVSYYCSRGLRNGQKEKVFFLYDVLDQLFEEGANCVVGIIQERDTPEETETAIQIHRRLGYIRAGRLPKFFDGKTAHLVAMSRDRWLYLDKDIKYGGRKRIWRKHRSKQFGD